MSTIFSRKKRPKPRPPESPPSSSHSRQQKRDALSRMKGLMADLIPIVQKAAGLASEATSDVAVPGLSMGLSALAAILEQIQTMKKAVEGVDTLHDRVGELSRIVTDFYERPRTRAVPDNMKKRLENLSRKWEDIAEQAKQIGNHGAFKRFFTADADAEKLEGFIKEICDSIQLDAMRGLLSIEERVEGIHEDVQEVRGGVRNIVEDVAAVQEDLDQVNEGVEALHEDVAAVKEDVVVVQENVDKVAEGVAKVDEGVAKVKEGVAKITAGVAEVKEGVQEAAKDVHNIKVHLDASFMPTYAKRAHYKASNVRKACLDGTRVDLLEGLWKWILTACAQTGADITYLVYWINGLAGTGKTTIAVSIAERCEAKGLLAASFCCARDDAECNKPDLVFVTISRQLCYYFPPLKEKVAEVLSQNPDVVYSDASTQFEKLILEPLEKLKCDFPRSVIVIDALDECHDTNQHAMSTIVGTIAKFDSRIARVLAFVVTSRPEYRVAFGFGKPGTLNDSTTRLLLHEVNLDLVSDDIHRYLRKQFADAVELRRLPANWPPSGDMLRLVQLSAGLFIWAATAFLFIMDPNFYSPQDQLQELLGIQPIQPTAERTAGSTVLDPLYDKISEAAFSKISPTLVGRLQSILGTILLAQEPLSVAMLGALTGTVANDIRRTLDRLHSVLHIPESDDEPIRIIHPTFAEYLFRASPSKPRLFSIDAAEQHAHLLSQALSIIEESKTNIADFPTPSTLRSEVTRLTKIVEERISAAVSYSCRHWSAHLEQCGDAEQITAMLDSLVRFFRTQVLKWLEVSSLLGALDKSIASLQAARTACQGYGDSFVPLSELIFDCLRFTQTYAPRIHDAPLQLYHSLIALAPEGSLVKQQYTRGLDQSLLITHGALSDWGPCIDTIIGHIRCRIYSVSFSGDGAYFATGGGDGYVRIWRTVTRTSVKAIPAGDGNHRVAFSPDGTRVASVPGLRIWDIKTGDVVHTLEHDGADEVAYSADGTRLASGSSREIKLWDPLNGTCLGTIASVCAGYFTGMAISPDGTLVGGNTAEGHAAICNISSKVPEVFDQEKGPVAAFPPDGLHVASLSSGTVRIWTLQDKALARTIDASSSVWCVAFSHSSTQIGCGYRDGRVHIWTVASDDPPRVFAGHTGDINALAWSPDDTQVISVGDDGTIRVWDLIRHRSNTTLAASPHSSLPLLPGAPCYAVFCTPDTTALFSLPAPIQPSTAGSDAAEDAPVITLHANMADAWEAVPRGSRASGEFAASRDWAFLTGRLHISTDESWPVAMTPVGSLSWYQPTSGEVKIHNHGTGDHPPLSLRLQPEALTFSFDNSYLAAADSRTLSIWDVTSQSDSPIRKIDLKSFSYVIAYSHNGSLLVAGTRSGDIHIYDVTTGQSVQHLPGTRGVVTQITFSTDDRHVIAQAHPWLTIWDIMTGEQILEFTSTHDHLLHSFDFAADDTGILVSDGKGGTTRVTLWNPGERRWPAYTVTEDGWLYAKGPGKVRRLCWLPPEWRAVFPLGGPRFCAPDREQRRVVVFDVSRIPEYVETWGAESEGALTG